MKNWKELVGAVCLLALLGGCGIKHGTVVDKTYRASYTYTTDHCVSYNKNNQCSLNIPMPQVEPEHYYLELKNAKGEDGTVEVDARTFHFTNIGSEY